MYIYHIIPDPFHGSSLIPLNQMDLSSDLYKNYASKYIGREGLMNTMIPKLNCKWNDGIHFSCIDPKIVASEIKKIKPDLKLRRANACPQSRPPPHFYPIPNFFSALNEQLWIRGCWRIRFKFSHDLRKE